MSQVVRQWVCQAVILAALLSLFFAASPAASADVNADRQAVAATIAEQISKAQLHKIYVADFLDSTSSLDASGARTDKGCYFASVFSTDLTALKNGFDVLNRVDMQKQLIKAQVDPGDLNKPEMFRAIAKGSGADGILWGSFRQQETGPMVLELSLRQADTGKELFHAHYQEASTDTFEALFPAATNDAGSGFYFPGLDGIDEAKCAQCPQVAVPDAAKDQHIQGQMILSAMFTKEGGLDETRVVHSLYPGLDQVVLQALNKWKITPAQVSPGVNISIRQCIQLKFDGSGQSSFVVAAQSAAPSAQK
jgi:TonB family protein